VSTSVNPVASTGFDQLQSSRLALLNTNMDSDNRYKQCGIPTTQVYWTSSANAVAPRDPYPSLEQVSQGNIISQNSGHLSTQSHEFPLMSPPTAPCFPEQNHYWPEVIQSSHGHDQRAQFQVNLQVPTLPSSEFESKLTLPLSVTIQDQFTNAPKCTACPGYCACNTVVATTPTDFQLAMSLAAQQSPRFESPGSSGIRVQTVPDHFSNGHMPPQGLTSEASGSGINFLTDELENLPWYSRPLPSQVQDNWSQLPANSVDIDQFALANEIGDSFGVDAHFQPEFNTFGGYGQPSCSSNGTAMMTNRSQGSTFDQTTHLSDTFPLSTLESSLSSSHFLFSQSDIFSNEHFLLHESTPHPSQLNPQLYLSPQPFQTSTSRPSTTSMSICQSYVSDHAYI
jgi:hypothetical protein